MQYQQTQTQQQQGYQQQGNQQQGNQQQGYQQQGYQQPQQQLQVNQVQIVEAGYQPPNVYIIPGGGMNIGGGALNQLAQLQSVYIKQKFEFLEALFGWEVPNTYLVWAGDSQGNITGQMPIFRFKERSACCQRICLPGDCRTYQLFGHDFAGMLTVQNKQIYLSNAKQVFRMDRPCAYTCLCLNRPFIDIFSTQNEQNIFIGKIVQPYMLCNHGVHIFDKNNELLYIVEASCLQAIFWCNLPCKSCQTCKFLVYNKDRTIITDLMKESQGCCKACIGDQGDSFRVMFPQGANPEHKALLMAAALFIDYRFFEQSKQADNGLEV